MIRNTDTAPTAGKMLASIKATGIWASNTVSESTHSLHTNLSNMVYGKKASGWNGSKKTLKKRSTRANLTTPLISRTRGVIFCLTKPFWSLNNSLSNFRKSISKSQRHMVNVRSLG